MVSEARWKLRNRFVCFVFVVKISLLVFITINVPRVVKAESLPVAMVLPSVFSFETGGDVESNRNLYLDLDAGFESGPRVVFSFSSNRSENNNETVITRSVLVGVRSNPMAFLSGGLDIEQWGNDNTLIIDTLRLALEINAEQWSFSLRPQWRTLTLSTDCIDIISARCDANIKVKSTGAAFDVNYYAEGPWLFSMGFARQRYDRNVAVLGTDRRLQYIFSSATLDLATGLEGRRSRLGASYFLDDSSWSVSWLRSVSEVTGDASVIIALRYSTDLNEQWGLSLNLGRQALAGTSEKIEFAGMGLSYRW